MKQIYPQLLLTLVVLLVTLVPGKLQAQCSGGHIPGAVAFDTTINFSSGRITTQLKFPKFDPDDGAVTCARLTMEMTGTLNFLRFENEDAAVNTAEAEFKRNDTISGPGLSSPLLNEEIQPYGPYSLDPSDGVPFSGTDFVNIGPQSIFTRTRTVIITNPLVLDDFYGDTGDSLTYNYSVDSRTTTAVSGNWSGGAFTTGTVTYRLEYCYCPPELLPINAFDFNVKKDGEMAQLTWKANTDQANYYYEIEYSTDGSNFTSAGIIEKQSSYSEIISYNYLFTKNSSNQTYYFRLKQKFATGKIMLSNIKSIDFGGDQPLKFSLYPNPSSGIIGIKFDNNKTGKILVSITNIQGQQILNKELDIRDDNYRQIATLQKGMYWLKMVDVESQKSCVNQLLIK